MFGYTPVSDADLPSYSCDGDVVFCSISCLRGHGPDPAAAEQPRIWRPIYLLAGSVCYKQLQTTDARKQHNTGHMMRLKCKVARLYNALTVQSRIWCRLSGLYVCMVYCGNNQTVPIIYSKVPFLTGRNCTGPPCSISCLSSHGPDPAAAEQPRIWRPTYLLAGSVCYRQRQTLASNTILAIRCA